VQYTSVIIRLAKIFPSIIALLVAALCVGLAEWGREMLFDNPFSTHQANIAAVTAILFSCSLLATMILMLLAMWRRASRPGASRGLIAMFWIFLIAAWLIAAGAAMDAFGWPASIWSYYFLYEVIGALPLGIIGSFFWLHDYVRGTETCIILMIAGLTLFAAAASDNAR
jgi:hypothetical protein